MENNKTSSGNMVSEIIRPKSSQDVQQVSDRSRIEMDKTSQSLRSPSKMKEALSQTRVSARNAYTKTKARTKEIVESSRAKTKIIVDISKDHIERQPWLLPLKWLMQLPRHWPRCSAIFFGVVLPLWILILVSMGFGILLAQYESGEEITGNDEILAARARIAYYDVSRFRLLNITNTCLARWERNVLDGTDVNDAEDEIDLDINSNETDIDLTNEEFLNENDADGDGFVYINRTLLEVSLDRCTRSFVPQLEAFQEATSNNSAAFDSLSFNWNRCWDLKQNNQFIFYPTDKMKNATHPSEQEAYYKEEWNTMQMALFEQYLTEGDVTSPEGEYAAFLRSVEDATGIGACEPNMGGTAWFFFTIMTTIGYGNQAPVTREGRLLVVSAGLFSLILFGAVLGLCGYVLLAIFNDTVSRFHSCASCLLSNPLVGMMLWGTIWLLYALVLETDIGYWWQERLPEFYEDISRGDTLWFAFISTSTIGLGDFYLQPEVIFASDTLKYSVLFMIGFVFLSTFFAKTAESLSYLLPQKHNSLEARLAGTRVLACWPRGFVPWEASPPPGETEIEVADMAPDDQALIYRIEQLKELKPDPPVEEDGHQERSLVSSLTGKSIHSMNIDLLQEEELLLKEWLAVVQHQKSRAIKQTQAGIEKLVQELESLEEDQNEPDEDVHEEVAPESAVLEETVFML